MSLDDSDILPAPFDAIFGDRATADWRSTCSPKLSRDWAAGRTIDALSCRYPTAGR